LKKSDVFAAGNLERINRKYVRKNGAGNASHMAVAVHNSRPYIVPGIKKAPEISRFFSVCQGTSSVGVFFSFSVRVDSGFSAIKIFDKIAKTSQRLPGPKTTGEIRLLLPKTTNNATKYKTPPNQLNPITLS
jgi:hypothetical protein